MSTKNERLNTKEVNQLNDYQQAQFQFHSSKQINIWINSKITYGSVWIEFVSTDRFQMQAIHSTAQNQIHDLCCLAFCHVDHAGQAESDLVVDAISWNNFCDGLVIQQVCNEYLSAIEQVSAEHITL